MKLNISVLILIQVSDQEDAVCTPAADELELSTLTQVTVRIVVVCLLIILGKTNT